MSEPRKRFVSGCQARIGTETFQCIAEVVAVPQIVDFAPEVRAELESGVAPLSTPPDATG